MTWIYGPLVYVNTRENLGILNARTRHGEMNIYIYMHFNQGDILGNVLAVYVLENWLSQELRQIFLLYTVCFIGPFQAISAGYVF